MKRIAPGACLVFLVAAFSCTTRDGVITTHPTSADAVFSPEERVLMEGLLVGIVKGDGTRALTVQVLPDEAVLPDDFRPYFELANRYARYVSEKADPFGTHPDTADPEFQREFREIEGLVIPILPPDIAGGAGRRMTFEIVRGNGFYDRLLKAIPVPHDTKVPEELVRRLEEDPRPFFYRGPSCLVSGTATSTQAVSQAISH